MLLRRENISVLKVVTYRIVQSWALSTASKQCSQPAWIRDQAINGKNGIPKESLHREYMFSASTEKGPVTPRIVRGWIERTEKIMPHNPVLKTTSILPQFFPV